MRKVHDGTKETMYFSKVIDKIINQRFDYVASFGEDDTSEYGPSTLFLGTTKKASLECIKDKVDEYDEHPCHIVIIDYFKDSMINKSYIKHYLEKGKSDNRFRYTFVEFLERDYIQCIDDEHNHEISIKDISRYRKKRIYRLLKEHGYRKVKKGRVGYADSTVVE